ncbi:MAG TPA: SUMF1/EgtB/PvdO family nonheme iron enzyme [Bryobacteraceae bacterium]|nr:SUMF1/EgtB/PvdO family nonheme iron enzyme [Bryobacteraceae bacterium]
MAPKPHLAEALAAARERTDELFGLLVPDAMYDRPIPERHRNIFYLGHLEAFDWNLICRRGMDQPSFHPEFDKLFEFGIDPPIGRLPEDKPSDWPAVAEVHRYNQRVREGIDRALISGGAPEQYWHVAIEHRLMHAETFAYMLHNLDPNRKLAPAGSEPVLAGAPATPTSIEVPAGIAVLGKRRGNGFGWDNEFEEHCARIPAFAMDKYKVTNGQYLEFVKRGASAPFFWVRRGGEWFQRTMFGAVPLPLEWPVYVTQEEATAFALWSGKALPTEAQFHRAMDRSPNGGGNYDFRSWDPVPVTAGAEKGFAQLRGNGWEWTSTVFEPFSGFEPFPFYPGYSANFFDGQHYVLKGASARTAACFLRPSFRNWFRPNYPYVYAGFRCVENRA